MTIEELENYIPPNLTKKLCYLAYQETRLDKHKKYVMIILPQGSDVSDFRTGIPSHD